MPCALTTPSWCLGDLPQPPETAKASSFPSPFLCVSPAGPSPSPTCTSQFRQPQAEFPIKDAPAGSGERTRLVRSLPCKHEGWSEKPGRPGMPMISSLEGGDWRIPELRGQEASPSVRSGFSERSCFPSFISVTFQQTAA